MIGYTVYNKSSPMSRLAAANPNLRQNAGDRGWELSAEMLWNLVAVICMTFVGVICVEDEVFSSIPWAEQTEGHDRCKSA